MDRKGMSVLLLGQGTWIGESLEGKYRIYLSYIHSSQRKPNSKIMKNLARLALLFVLLPPLYSCGFEDWDVKELYVQKIEGTSKLLYKYDAWGGRDSHNAGFVILDSGETFEVNLKNDLPFYSLQEAPTQTTIKGVSHICSNSCGEDYKSATPVFIPIKKEIGESHGIETIHLIYQYKGYSERSHGFYSYQFEKFKETRDSLWFYNLDEFENGNQKHVDSLKFKKTDIAIRQDKSSNVIRIDIKYLIIAQQSNEILSDAIYHLTPKAKLSSRVFSDYGIFKEVVK
jgi:hypothetical protein